SSGAKSIYQKLSQWNLLDATKIQYNTKRANSKAIKNYPILTYLPASAITTMKMENLWSRMVPLLLLTTFFLLPSDAHVHDYVRQPPKRIVHTPHNGSEYDPQQVHISLVGRDHMRVSWVTEDSSVKSMVQYGKEQGMYNAMATGEHTSYQYFFYSSPTLHHVKIGPLEASTTYYYRCGGHGPEFSFKTPPPALPIEFAVVGDLGETEWTKSTLTHVDSKDYDLFLLPGDLSYADTQQSRWDSFGRLVQPYASRRPWMVTEGNHEVESFFPILFPKAFTAYNARWKMPHEESGSTSNLYYSFEVAGSHIVMLGSYTDFDADSDQYKWLQADLENVDRKKTPWIIVVLHAPWYNTNTAHQGEGESMRKAMERLLYKARVDVVFAGHVHAYERFTRIFDNKADPCGPVYITIGDGGNREGLALRYKNPASALTLYREPSFGHGRLRLLDETRAYWSWQRNNDTDSAVADEVWLQSLSSSAACSNITLPKQPSTYKNDEF
ncbi:Metallophos domain-containing protein/Metallophos_C domain-containing protein, partial [Cephalotus follicularis]